MASRRLSSISRWRGIGSRKYKNCKSEHFQRLGMNETSNRQKFGSLLITFVLGIVFMIMFGGSLYCGEKVDKQNQKNKTEVVRKQAIPINETNHIRRQWGNKK